MSSKDKPYKVYRGGRTKGPIKPIPKESPRRDPKPAHDGDGYDGAYAPAPKKRRRWGRKVAALLVLVIVLAIVWGILGFLAFRSGVKDANARLDPKAMLRWRRRRARFSRTRPTCSCSAPMSGARAARGQATAAPTRSC